MDRAKIVSKLQTEFPGMNIICIPDTDTPDEIICELDPSIYPSEFYGSTAIAYIDKSAAHFHKYTQERYQVESGQLILTVEEEQHFLGVGAQMEIPPGKIHSAVGEATRVRVYATPKWTEDDHHLVGFVRTGEKRG